MYPIESKYEKVYIGMKIRDFLSIHKEVKNEYMNRENTIYSITYYKDKNGQAFANVSDVTYKKFYYFENNELVKVDKGERAVDYRIKIN